ncbi:RbtT/DalT/CsbX family MFS transporter [Bacillus atrophaeus]|uniref:RbtT/DalT/CsbX family MFS transporter n=1 Tax=Bacillus atrophaeus TaxID=1452 RepID=UPI0022820ACE|nr:RbtT/DalT/CsbX family MFS transporter [Bacillus atrophaeus]MCY7947636.1 RbtT/DalT/CsbX family MFS transporter [Bacillus atrophaeus]MCY8095500.1 RbtT/DalT/CsbX family MFS transporter [Bacillus atrophaeus]MCY9168692.1 RbtT/DalT/CsbX family MFS transporter [Bacillus atrophaeus]MEC0742637.1 RbtT/DalT/CsbX family MFS transporter [Bacillus atrophaeus]MEC0744049.1 RbtT/DalT/CsbX family MFS transporter [Bacillus atrophaeus]
MNSVQTKGAFLNKIGIPSHLVWGYMGIVIFMIGDGLEQGWLSPFLVEHGLSMQQSASLYTFYGIAVTISAWFSGIFVQAWGPKKAMTAGLIAFILGSAVFIGWAIPHMYYPALLGSYALRGLGYPLFAYSFLVWVSYSTSQQILGKAVGWFWFVFTCGLNVLGPFYSSFAVPLIGEINTLWSALVFVAAGGILALFFNKDKFTAKQSDHKWKELSKAFTIMYENPKVGIGGIVKTINALGQFGFAIFLPIYLAGYGYSVSEWLQIWGTLFFVNIVFNLIFGIVGDKLGWRNTVMWFGGVGSGIFTLAIYYTPQIIGHNYWVLMIIACCYGACLAGYIPLSALMPTLAPDNKGAAMSVLNLGSGLCAFIAPGIVSLFIGPLGAGGVIWIFAVLYFFSTFLTQFLKLPESGAVHTEKREVSRVAKTNFKKMVKP